MAENGRWFKLWTTVITDPDLSNLSLENFARWCKLGAYIKLHGDNGKVKIQDSIMVRAMFQVDLFEHLISAFRALPNIIIESVTDVTVVNVTFKNWQKYQGDFSNDRVKKHRESKSYTGNGLEEKRREEKRQEEIRGVVDEFWKIYPHRNGVKQGKQETIQAITDHVKSGEYALLIQAAKNFACSPDAKKGIGVKDPQRFIISGRGENKTFPWKEWVNHKTELVV